MKILKNIAVALLIILLAIGIFIYPKINRVLFVNSLFEKDKIVENFRSLHINFAHSTLIKSENPNVYPRGRQITLPDSFKFDGNKFSTRYFLDSSYTTGILVVQNDSIIYEEYMLGNTAETQLISWSVAKSFISALFGIAVQEGHIKSVHQNVEDYVPELKGTAYEGVMIKDVLQMSTGVEFNEDYGDFNSDINRWGRGFAFMRPQDNFPATLERERAPGSYHHYVSINTHVLGMIVARATGKSITEYMQEKLWTPVGMEDNAYWLIDSKDVEMYLGGLNATLRDYAKIGTLFLNEGNSEGQQIVPKDWVRMSTKPDAPHLLPGKNEASSHYPLGYGYQWWIPEGNEGEFLALGFI